MAIKKILKMGNPLLRKKSIALTDNEILSEETNLLIRDMKDTMEHANGLGIAAPQIGISKQIAIIKLTQNNPRYKIDEPSKTYIIINPIIEVINDSKQGFWEGCLSVPGIRGHVERPSVIKVTYKDEFAKQQIIKLEGFIATVFQHELDHLQGILYIDRVSDTKKLCFTQEYNEFWSYN